MHDLGCDIVGGRYLENTNLPGDTELMERFGVSRTVLREALKTLSAKGLIQAKAKIGTRVRERRFWNLFDPDILTWHVEAGADRAFLSHLSEMRMALEPEAAALAAERRTNAQSRDLFLWVERMGEARTEISLFVEADLRFHIAVAEASGNPFMRSISALIEVALAITFAISSPLPDQARHALTVSRHRAIADAIERRDAKAARAAMRVVIDDGSERVADVTRAGTLR
ncbi:FadR family transcriptional regulator [Mesorhizobium sp. RP14(2022)]|uniref:FadR family transcriptional regulator n=1 Tax=Mesorhizobium liriopis TaxID=2953882 RepID=A0ABT1C9S8_9HYPH|nr:FadR/GntR family transcriptional regulator [Mesorhizobium liriopis]MCO6051581.1 FadR family transcriptional regulator [Mesorhizobium liriopis]